MQGSLILKTAKNCTEESELVLKIKTYLKPLTCSKNLKTDELNKYAKFCYSLVRIYADKFKDVSEGITDQSLDVVSTCCWYYMKIYHTADDYMSKDFCQCLIYIVYLYSQKNPLTAAIYQILKYYFQIINQESLQQHLQISILFHIFSACFIILNDLNKSDVEFGQEIAKFCYGDKVEEHSNQLACILISKISNNGKTMECVRKCIQFCNYISKFSNEKESLKFFAYFLVNIYNYTMKNCENDVKCKILQIIINLFLMSDIVNTDETKLMIVLQIYTDISKPEKVNKVILKILQCEFNFTKVLFRKILNLYINKNSNNYEVIFENLNPSKINFVAKIELSCIYNYVVHNIERFNKNCYTRIVEKYLDFSRGQIESNRFDSAFKILLKVARLALLFRDIDCSTKTLNNIISSSWFERLSSLDKAKSYLYNFISSYPYISSPDHKIKKSINWHEQLPDFPIEISFLNKLCLSQQLFYEYVNSDTTKITLKLIDYVFKVCILLCAFKDISLAFGLFDAFLKKILASKPAFSLGSIIKMCVIFKLISHGLDFRCVIDFVNFNGLEIRESFEFKLLKILEAKPQKFAKYLKTVINILSDGFSQIYRISQIWFLIVLQYLLDSNLEVLNCLIDIKFPLKTKCQCLFLAVKFIDQILQTTEPGNLITNSPELLFLNLFCLKKCSKYLIDWGCYREADGFLCILAQQSYFLYSPLYLKECLNILMDYLEPTSYYSESIQKIVTQINTNLITYHPDLDFTHPHFKIKIMLEYLDLKPAFYDCKNTVTTDLFNLKLRVIKNKDLCLGTPKYINCCDKIGYDLKEVIYQLKGNSLFSLFENISLSQKSKSPKNKQLDDSLFFPCSAINFKLGLRSFVFTNYGNLNYDQLSACLECSICLAFFSYYFLNQTKYFSDYFTNNINSNENYFELVNILNKPEIRLREITKYWTEIYQQIPKDWVIIHLSYFSKSQTSELQDYIIITIHVGSISFVHKKSVKYREDFNFESELKQIIADNDASSAHTGGEYWDHRYQLEERLKKYVEYLDSIWFDGIKYLIRGKCSDESFNLTLRTLYNSFVKSFKKSIVYMMLSNDSENTYGIFKRIDPNVTKASINWISKNCEGLQDVSTKKESGPIILIVDEHIYDIPFESFPTFSSQTVTRMPSLLSTILTISRWKEKIKNDSHVLLNGNSCYYVLNPGDNLSRTQKYFENTFKSMQEWTGLISKAPSESECLTALKNHELFLYCGHGNGKQYLKNEFIKKCTCRAVPILMGCHSAKLYKYFRGDHMGTIFYYLMSGSPAVVANLWGVTDKDIDHFLDNVLFDMLTNSFSLGESVSRNRSKCHLPSLNGAAPIVYGIPIKFRSVNYPLPPH